MTSFCPPVRELQPGDQPRNWANDPADADGAESGDTSQSEDLAGPDTISDPLSTAPARRELPPVTGPQQYQMQFCTSEEHVKLVERAKALLARTSPGASLGELHLQAMKLLVEKLEKQKFAVSALPRKTGESRAVTAERANRREEQAQEQQAQEQQALRAESESGSMKRDEAPRQRRPSSGTLQRRSGRHVPAGVKREVFVRDGGCCSYVDERGVRCGETRYLELHHLQAYGHGGQHLAANLTLRCAAHNALAAEEDFGRARVERMRDSPRHESFAALARANRAPASRPDI
jgi:hypothetical protein